MSLSVYKPNVFTYPGYRLPGIDPTHVACARGVPRFSGVAIGNGSFFDYLKGAGPSSITGSPTAKIIGTGPAVSFGTSDALNFSGHESSFQPSGTIAAIVQFNSVGVFEAVFTNNSSNSSNGINLFSSNGSVLMCRFAGNNISSVIALNANIPYFLAVSGNTPDGPGGGTININYLARNLSTGQVFTDFQTVNIGTGANATSDGTYLVGQWAGGTLGTNGSVVCAAYLNNFLSKPELLEFAADPWAFWYPRRITDAIFNAFQTQTDILYPQSIF